MPDKKPETHMPLDLLAKLIAQRKNGDQTAADYLASLGKGFTEPEQVSLQHPDLPDDKSHTRDLEKAGEQKPTLSMDENLTPYRLSFFILKKQINKESFQDSLVPTQTYNPGDDPPTHAIIKKPPPYSLVETLADIKRLLKSLLPSHKISVKKAVHTLSKGRALQQLPKQKLHYEADSVVVYMDNGVGMQGFRDDMRDIFHQLQKDFSGICEGVVFPDGPDDRWYVLGKENTDNMPLPGDHGVALIITQGANRPASRWRRLLGLLEKNNSKPLWLLLGAPDYSPPGQYQIWGGTPKHTPVLSLEQLTALLSASRLVTGPMLRDIIQSQQLPVVYEAEFWAQENCHYQFCDKGHVTQLLTAYTQLLSTIPLELVSIIANCVNEHLSSYNDPVRHEFNLNLSVVLPQWQSDDLKLSQDYFQGFAGSMATKDSNSHDIAQFLRITSSRLTGLITEAPVTIQQTLAWAAAINFKNFDLLPHRELAIQAQQLVVKDKKQSQEFQLCQLGNQLLVKPVAADGTMTSLKGPPVITNFFHKPEAPLYLADEQGSVQAGFREDTVTVAKDLHKFQIISTDQILELQQHKGFYWQQGVTITERGVKVFSEDFDLYMDDFYGFEDGLINAQNHKESPLRIKEQASPWLHKASYSLDQYGIYADLDIKNFPLRFRYIPPGRFLMGSPEDEAERWDDETQHPVSLTQGYWLAETCVVQGLWKVLMKNNPSHFTHEKSDKLPVDNVSWNDCQSFIKKLNKAYPIFRFQLPTEAQWEYACRAGTTTPFSFGEQISSEQVNFDGNRPYNNGESSHYRQQTVSVKSLPPNNWGLYEMHGNLWEWCQDNWQEKLGHEGQIDPMIQNDSGECLLRGGGWGDYGRSCRSACRGDYHAGGAYRFIGLRLVLGHELQGGGTAAGMAHRAESGATPNGTDTPKQLGAEKGLMKNISRLFTHKKDKKKHDK